MNLRRVGIIWLKDLRYGSRNFVFIFAIVMPLVLSLVIGLLFGSIFSETPTLGLADADESRLAAALLSVDYLRVQTFPTEAELRTAVEAGAVEVGLALPPTFDADVIGGAQTEVTIAVWGQSLVRNRAIISAAITEAILAVTGRETPIAVNAVLVGDRPELSWQQRLLPLIVLMSVVFGGMLVPATLMIDERQKRTLTAITTTPMTLGEVLFAKGLMGVLLSVFSATMTLTLNGGWGPNPGLLLLVLVLSGTLAAAFGLLMGTRVKDIQTLFAINKSMGIVLYAPALIQMFPDIPQWIAQVFPTYYILQPVLDISQRGAGPADVAVNLLVLTVITAILIAGLGMSADRLQVQAA